MFLIGVVEVSRNKITNARRHNAAMQNDTSSLPHPPNIHRNTHCSPTRDRPKLGFRRSWFYFGRIVLVELLICRCRLFVIKEIIDQSGVVSDLFDVNFVVTHKSKLIKF